MKILRCQHFVVLTILYINGVNSEKAINLSREDNKSNCSYSKVIEDIFKINNITTQAGSIVENNERTKIFLDSFASKTNEDSNKTSIEELLVNNIIASINRIKNNITSENGTETKLNEAIILNSSKREPTENSDLTKVETFSKSDKDKPNKESKKDEIRSSSTERPNYVEILTIEPNNTSRNNSSTNNIIQMLKHLMPMFNTTLTNELHNITIIETNRNKNHSISAMRNVSKIVVTYCDNENFTKLNASVDLETDVDIKVPANGNKDDDYYVETDYSELIDEDYDDVKALNLTVGEKKDIMEATEYGMQKMHELYSITEPKLYSMGLWLDDANPARYVAAFNAPAEDVAKYSRYGYASLQAATRLKQLTSNGYNDGLEGRTEEAQFPSVSALRQSPLLEHCPLRGAPKCPPASKRYRTHDGTCNNFNRPRWGSTKTPVQRFQPPAYSDGLQAPRRSVFGSKLPSAREISSLIHEDQNVEASSITHLLMQWGQFLDHDVTSTSQSRGFNGSVPRCCKDGGRDFVPREFMHPECLPISVPASDPFYGPRGVRCLDFVRSSPAPRDDCALGWREQLNQVSAYIDASPVYASSARQSDKLRLFRNGMLQYGRVQQRRPLLPRERRDSLCRGGAVSADCFRSGDARVNEHPGLVAAHIIWLRQHNRMAQELAHLNPQWSDEKIYQETRKIVGAMIQHITYREFLPIVLGEEVMRLFELEPLRKGYFKGYNTKVNPSPASSFGSAAFRFGHSLVQSSMVRYDKFHRPLNNNVSLHDELTNPSNIWSMGAVDRLLLGMVNQPIQKRDEFITEELTNHLFQTPSFDFGMDLAAINIQRGRDHGIASYTSWREPCGLSTILDFEDLFRVMPARTVRKMQALYRHVDDIDLFTGGMAERPVVGGLVGPTFSCIIAQQFSNLRKGDRFWYENGGFESSFTPAQLQQIRRISFAQVLCRTLDNINDIQPFVFLSSESPDNDRVSCRNALFNNFDLSPWTEINSDSNNDISKTDDDGPTTQRPKKTKRPTVTHSTTTTRSPSSTQKTDLETAASNKVEKKQKPSTSLNLTTIRDNKFKPTVLFNKTDFDSNDKNNTNKLTKPDIVKINKTETKIDDKLDFKNKSRRYEEIDRIDQRHNYNRPNNYDDDEEVQSVQSIVINNVSNKRPYNRPAISVTENIDKFTYLINYVPRPTQSWRQTTRRTFDRDVVKVTYQNYDDTYRRPYKPYYYNRHDDKNYNDNYRRNRPTDSHDTHMTDTENMSSARSRDDLTQTTTKTDSLLDKTLTTENVYKLVTFGYVGTYKGNRKDRPTTILEKNDKKDIDNDKISKDFSTDDLGKSTTSEDSLFSKLSTFYHYDTATRPYNLLRPTRRNDELEFDSRSTSDKYYYVQNKLHKYPNIDFTMTEKPFIDNKKKDIIKQNYNTPEEIEERSAVKIDAFVDEVDSKSANSDKLKIKLKKPSAPAKTPSVAFQIIPSENSPSHWAVFEEVDDLPGFQKMPSLNKDPQASKEIPRPIDFKNLRRRKPGNI